MTFKVFVSFLLFIASDIFCQDMQIVMETKSYFNAPVVGKINLYQTTFLAKNQKNTREVTSIEKRLFGFLAGLISDVNDTTGHLIAFDGKQWGYNKNNKEYWDHLKKLTKAIQKVFPFLCVIVVMIFYLSQEKSMKGWKKFMVFKQKNTQPFLKR